MTRRRLAVALLVPQPVATEVDGLRRACGDPRRERIAPHITLVPPVNVAEDRVEAVREWCRAVAGATSVLRLTLGAPSTFAPTTPLAWLAVGGDLDALIALHDALNAGPLARPAEHPFVPHVTISDKAEPDRLQATLSALADFHAACTVDRLHLLANQQLADGRWGWVPISDAGFGRPRRIAVGGLALDLTVGATTSVDERSVTVTGRRDGELVGMAAGSVSDGLARLDKLMVGEGHRRQGIGSHLLARFVAEAVERSCERAAHVAPSDSPVLQLCRQRGWTEIGSGAGLTTVVRLLGERRGSGG